MEEKTYPTIALRADTDKGGIIPATRTLLKNKVIENLGFAEKGFTMGKDKRLYCPIAKDTSGELIYAGITVTIGFDYGENAKEPKKASKTIAGELLKNLFREAE